MKTQLRRYGEVVNFVSSL